MDEATNWQDAWFATRISDHHILNEKGKRPWTIPIKVHWESDQPTWVQLDMLRIQQPHMLMDYALN